MIVCKRPESAEEAAAWRPEIRHMALARHVLVVANTRIEGAWSAYCDAVLGHNHDEEKGEVLRTGCKICEKLARHIFPDFDGPYAR